MPLDLQADLPQLALEIVNVPSVSGNETALADALEQSLRSCAHLTVWRNGDALVARTELGHTQRAIIAGHLDTVPVANNLPGRLDSDELIGRGSVDMKAGVAVMAQLAAQLTRPKCDITWVFYDHEEVASNLSGLGRLIRCQPEWLLDADFGVLCEPTGGQIEVGCNGSLRVALQTAGRRAHTARAWMGDNAIHRMAPHLLRLAELVMPTVTVNNFAYRESLQAVGVQGGVAGNVVPDTCTAQINYRFAPDKTPDQALTQLLAYLFPNELVDFGNDLSIGQKISLS
ncbi:MAG: succinyl-diaminopimelate desuccinylase, partial [Bifidobacteriaceae bacterium]|nr:succinyl-diaminopimelate desuccinylase [Bifidobacteriaceae bacterium]